MGTTVQRSKTVDLLKVLLCLGIVFRHAELVGVAGRSAVFAGFTRGMMLMTEACVPLFFALSGYLYFLNGPDKPTASWFLKKTRSRVFTLLIPYLIANTVAFAFYWLANRFAPDMVSGFFGEDWRNPLFIFWTGPMNLSLWFIRDLMYSVVLAPVIWLFVRYTRIWGVIALGVLWFYGLLPVYVNFCFIAGAWVAVSRFDVADTCRRAGPWLLLMYICSFVAVMADESLMTLSLLAALPVGIYLADALMRRCRWEIPQSWQAWCFFMYLYHYMPEVGLKKALIRFVDPSGFGSLLLVYLADAVVTIGVVTLIYLVLKKLLPRVTGVLVGGKA